MLATWKQRATFAAPLLALYWIALGVATHLPGENAGIPAQWDKLVHATAYGLLAFLAAFVWRGCAPARFLGYVLLWNALAVNAAIDEVTQPYFNRRCDLYDWIADVIGLLLGILVHVAWANVGKRNIPADYQESEHSTE